MNIGSAIKNIRLEKGMKQNLFAKKCNISQTYLSQIENSVKEPNLSTLRKISKKLGVPLPILFFLSLSESDIAPQKKAAYNSLGPLINKMLTELFVSQTYNK